MLLTALDDSVRHMLLLLMLVCAGGALVNCDIEYNTINEDGSYSFRHSNDDIGGYYHSASGTADNVVRGRYGSRNAATGQVEEVVYSAGPRGFRVNGPKIHRKMNLAQFPVGPIGSATDPLADPYDDPSYSFKFRTPEQSRSEENDATGRVRGLYSYVDDVGERHSVRYAAGAGTGFEVSNAVPDNPVNVGYTAPLYKAHPKTRGKMSVQRGPDGSYKLVVAGPDHRRAESRGTDGLVRGTYSFLDDKGVQRTVEYIAGAGIGYRVVQNRVGPGTHNNPSVSDFRLTDTDFRLSNDFGRGAGGGVSRGDGDTGDGGNYLKTTGSARANGKDNGKSNTDDERNVKEDDGEGDVSLDPETTSGRRGTADASNRVKSDRMGAMAGRRGGIRYRGGGIGGRGGADGDDINGRDDDDRDYRRAGTSKSNGKGNSRPSLGGNTLSANDQRTQNRNRYSGGGGVGGGGGIAGVGINRRPGGSMNRRGGGGGDYNYDAPSSSNNYNFNDDDVAPLPPLITANKKILEIDRDRDWVERHRDSTIIRNVGKWYIGLPPGQSVRAHVQNIDLLPLGGRRVPSPSEALRQDEIADMVASLESEASYKS